VITRENHAKDFAAVLFLTVSIPSLLAKDTVFQTVNWPESGQTVLRFSFSEFKEVGGMGKEHTHLTDTIAENVSDKTIGNASFPCMSWIKATPGSEKDTSILPALDLAKRLSFK
jgi:hypothetical protein